MRSAWERPPLHSRSAIDSVLLVMGRRRCPSRSWSSISRNKAGCGLVMTRQLFAILNVEKPLGGILQNQAAPHRGRLSPFLKACSLSAGMPRAATEAGALAVISVS